MNKEFRVKFILTIAFIFSASSLLTAQDSIKGRLNYYGEVVEFESNGVNYKLSYSTPLKGCFLFNMLTKKDIIASSQKYWSIDLVGSFVIANKDNYKKYHPSDIFNLEGKLLVKNFDFIYTEGAFTKNTIVVKDYMETQRLGLLNIDGNIILPAVYNKIKIIDTKNKIWEATNNDGVYIFDENTKKLSPKDGKEIVKAKLPEIKGYEFIVNYDFKEDSKIDIKPNDYLVNEIGNDLWFVFDVAKANSGIYNNKLLQWIVKPDIAVNKPSVGSFIFSTASTNKQKKEYVLYDLKHASEITCAYKNKDFFLINQHAGFDKKSKNYKYKCTVFDESKILKEIPFYVNKYLSSKLLSKSEKCNYFIIQDFSRVKESNYYSWSESFDLKVEINEESTYKDGDYGFGIANVDGTILLKPEYRLVKFIKLKDKNFINFDAAYNSSSIITFEILKDGNLVQNPEYENIITNKHYDKINKLDFNVLTIKKNGKWGLVNEQNEELIPFVSEKPICYYFGNFYSTEFEPSTRGNNYVIYSRSGEFIGKFESVNMNKDGGVHLLDRDKNENFDIYFDKKNNKVIKGENDFLAWKKDRIEFEKNNPSEFNEYVNKTSSSSGSMSKDWMEATKGYLTSFENFKRACDNFIKSTSNSNKKELQYWLDDIYAKNNYIIAILNHPNDKSLTAEELSNYRAIANQKKRDLNNFQDQLNKGVYTVLDALLYQLK